MLRKPGTLMNLKIDRLQSMKPCIQSVNPISVRGFPTLKFTTSAAPSLPPEDWKTYEGGRRKLHSRSRSVKKSITNSFIHSLTADPRTHSRSRSNLGDSIHQRGRTYWRSPIACRGTLCHSSRHPNMLSKHSRRYAHKYRRAYENRIQLAGWWVSD